jgi:carbamoyl-phosphate synthase small subunit
MPVVVAYDYGIKRNILRRLMDCGCQVTVVPATTPAEAVLAMQPDGIFLSNGPGDPAALPYTIAQVKRFLGVKPIMGICLGHQILALACGAETYKLKFGHHGGNQPIRDLRTERVLITAENHGFAVDPQTLPSFMDVTHVNLNDGTIEGMRHRELPVFSVQYHPEASPGPHDARYLFDQFITCMRSGQ